MKDRVAERIAKVAASLRQPAESAVEPAPVPVAPVARPRLHARCGRYYQGQECTPCAFEAFMASEPMRSPSGHPCAICGQTEAAAWVTAHDNFKIDGRTVSLPLCDSCQDVRSRDLSPAWGRELEESWLDFRAAQVLGLSEPWQVRGNDKWAQKSHGLVRAMVALGQDQRPLLACELGAGRYSQDGPTRAPLWWLPLSKTVAQQHLDDFGKIKTYQVELDTSTSIVNLVVNGMSVEDATRLNGPRDPSDPAIREIIFPSAKRSTRARTTKPATRQRR